MKAKVFVSIVAMIVLHLYFLLFFTARCDFLDVYLCEKHSYRLKVKPYSQGRPRGKLSCPMDTGFFFFFFYFKHGNNILVFVYRLSAYRSARMAPRERGLTVVGK